MHLSAQFRQGYLTVRIVDSRDADVHLGMSGRGGTKEGVFT